MRGVPVRAGLPSASLLYAHIPFHQATDLALGIAALAHAHHEFIVLAFRLAILLRPEADDRQQFLHLAEHAPLDHLADLFVAGPRRILTVVVRPCPQAELHHLVA